MWLRAFFTPLAALLLAAPLSSLAQTGGVRIGTAGPPAASAVLDLTAPDKGLLVPRLDSVARVGIASPATGLLVFQTGPRVGFYYYGGSGWLFVADKGRAGDNLGSGVATTAVNLQGNALVGTGASIGTAVGVGVRADGGLNLGQNTLYNNVYVGYQAGQATTTGSNNQFIGYGSGSSNTTGSQNQFSGYGSGSSNTTGSQNQFIGYRSGSSNTTGNGNQFSGYRSGYYNTTGSNNQFSGFQSGSSNTTGSGNQFSGYYSGQNNTTGDNNWAFGYSAGPTTGNLTNAGALGYNASVSQSNSLVLGGTGADAVKVGIGTTAPRGSLDVATAGDTYLVADPTNGNSQTLYLPGHLFLAPYSATDATAYVQARVPSPTASTNLALQFRTTNNGNLVQALRLNPSGSAVFAGPATGPSFTSTSDARFKTNVRPLRGALAAVQALRGVRYEWNALGVAHGGQAGAGQVGLIAQELEQVYPELVLTDAAGYKSVNYAQLAPVLLEALKELAARNATLEAQVAAQQTSSARLEQRLQALEAAGARADARK